MGATEVPRDVVEAAFNTLRLEHQDVLGDILDIMKNPFQSDADNKIGLNIQREFQIFRSIPFVSLDPGNIHLLIRAVLGRVRDEYLE